MRLKQEYRESRTIERSRFIACAAYCPSEADARAYITRIRAEFSDATHVCTAYLVSGGSVSRCSDNQEPAGTAGRPMLEAIQASGLDSVCVCVVRYFGGIKLGTGGLVRAYGGITRDVLNHAPKLREIPAHRYAITYPYELSGILEPWLRSHAVIETMDYGEQVSCVFVCRLDNTAEILRNLTSDRITPTCQGATVLTEEL